MPLSHRSARRGWVIGALLAGIGSLGAFAAQELGWFPGSPWFKPTAAGRDALASDGFEEAAPGLDNADQFELPARTLLAQTEPEETAPAPAADQERLRPQQGKVRHSQLSSTDQPTLEFEGIGDASRPGRANSKVVRAGFEEDAPPTSADSDEDAGRERKPAGADQGAVATRPGDASKAVSSLRSTDANPARGAPLLDREEIQLLIDDGDYVEAQKELSRWYWQMPAERPRLITQLNKMAQALYFSPQPMYYEPYVVKPGDQLRVVGQRYKLSWEYIARLNHVDARKIRMGQKLKIVPGPFAAVISLGRYELVIHEHGNFVKSYRVGVGQDGTTPLGTFTVKNKMVDPTYYGPEGVIAHDDPENPLGERWIDIGDSYGIHGTIDPESIGKNESRGCIRMLNSDVEEVYDFLVIGSEVKIQK
jgi:LysM repeat protein